ncbi:transcriptional repressor [Mycolicibacterium wolinskyi]|uniref:Fur family transcriptional regulator n=1 Tax=Mycolicibacterium wolinskyi TaxID=59750 RepID=A0A132PNU5_9MYCO|nr:MULTISPECIES: transcriptional repressor [Mycolicibacterium]KWX23944.1 Fur family transcriptional regulator [Mycolicibacterium wolinskyi]MCV7287894.1 transcriptional repressor [Mycolicibacterium wolinskyi]MCV7294792.1 transcriptional repressor [Mycolicibacterium goodii]ORX12677.1 Fur family transcriptional regulator [Mycolicibacterium wolinskyi]
MPDSAPAERLRQNLLSALESSKKPMSTAQLRDHIHEHFREPVVIEAVYRNLTVLERRGDVRRRKLPGRDAHWTRAD